MKINLEQIKVQVITWDKSPLSHAEQVRKLLKADCRWIQLRQKQGNFSEKKIVAKECAELCRNHQVTLVINDDPFLALESGASGVHLGLNDMPVSEARKLLGENFIIGATANTPEEALSQMDQGADYVGLGPYRYTETKENLSPLLGDAGVLAVVENCKERRKNGLRTVPLIVVGGVLSDDIAHLLSLGANGVAVSSTIVGSSDIALSYKRFMANASI